jgi:hypothetical protein
VSNAVTVSNAWIIDCVRRGETRITHVGGSKGLDGKPWCKRESAAIALIKAQTRRLQVVVPGARPVAVHYETRKTPRGEIEVLITTADGEDLDNLAGLESCPPECPCK